CYAPPTSDGNPQTEAAQIYAGSDLPASLEVEDEPEGVAVEAFALRRSDYLLHVLEEASGFVGVDEVSFVSEERSHLGVEVLSNERVQIEQPVVQRRRD